MPKLNKIIVLGSDHGGFSAKQEIKKWLANKGYRFIDVGNNAKQLDDDYPLFALLVAGQVVSLESQQKNVLGLLICRSGGGMAMAANKIKGVRAVDVFSVKSAIHARQHNHANILTLGQDFLSSRDLWLILKAITKTPVSPHPRHKRRLKEITQAESGRIAVTPSILEKSFSDIKKRLRAVAGLTDWVHIDVADNSLVANKTFLNLTAFKTIKLNVNKEAHLMVQQPLDYLTGLKVGGFKRVFVHIESKQAIEFIRQAKKNRLQVGIAVDVDTSLNKIQKISRSVDAVLIMGVKAGWSGQPFRAVALARVVKIKEQLPKMRVLVDGGVRLDNIAAIKAAGADRVTASSAIFKTTNPTQAFYQLMRYGN